MLKHAAHAESEGLLHPNPDGDRSPGAVCTSLLWGCSRVGAAQGNQAAAQLQSGPLLHRQSFQCLLSESHDCFCVAGHVTACAASRQSTMARGCFLNILNFQHTAAASPLQSAWVAFTLTHQQWTQREVIRCACVARGTWHRGM